MGLHDAELNIGVNFDADQFLKAYNDTLNKASAVTQTHVYGAVDALKGPASKTWETMPFDAMHDPKSGQRAAARAFVPSIAQDIKSVFGTHSQGYQSALIGAAHRVSTANADDLYHKLSAMGYGETAGNLYPGSRLSQMLETDYKLLQQDWSRDFIVTKKAKGLNAADLQKLNLADIKPIAHSYGLTTSRKKKADLINELVTASQGKQTYINFAGMREYAVKYGLGRWKDENGGNLADNFELIDKSVEELNSTSEKTTKHFTDWGKAAGAVSDTVKTILGTVVAIGAAGLKTFDVVNKKTEKSVFDAAGNLPNTRAFLGMNSLDVLETQVAGQSLSLGKDAIYSEIERMSKSIQNYKLLGKGDALPASLLGVFNTLIDASDPYGAYKSALQSIYTQLQGQDREQQQRTLALMDDAGLGTAAQVVGAFLSNPELTQRFNGNIAGLFSLGSNPYYGVYGRSEALIPDLTKYNESIKASYKQMALDWQAAFGEPFKGWWDKTLQDKVVPWFEKIVGYVKNQQEEEGTGAKAVALTLKPGDNVWEERNKQIEYSSGKAWEYVPFRLGKYKADARKIGNVDWAQWLSGDMNSIQSVKALRNQWDLFERIADTTDEAIQASGSSYKDPAQRAKGQAKLTAVRDRMVYLKERLKSTHLIDFINNGRMDESDYAILRLAQAVGVGYGEFGGENWQSFIDTAINQALSVGSNQDPKVVFSGWENFLDTVGRAAYGNAGGQQTEQEKMVKLLEDIKDNTAANVALLKDEALWGTLTDLYGAPWVETVKKQVQERANTANRQ